MQINQNLQTFSLLELREGEVGEIVRIRGNSDFRKRLTEMGFVSGTKAKVVKKAPLQDPIEYEIMGYHISLRRNEARHIEITTEQNDENSNLYEYSHRHYFHHKHHGHRRHLNWQSNSTENNQENIISIAFVGNPNCGKTSLFNNATGLHERVGNYSGVTVGVKSSFIDFENNNLEIIDLPGTYSLSDYSLEEKYVREYLFNQKPDVVVNIIDSTNLERNLYLTTQLLEMNVPFVIALNMYDELNKNNIQFNYERFAELIGVPIIPTVGTKGEGINELLKQAINIHNNDAAKKSQIKLRYNQDIENAIEKIQNAIANSDEIKCIYPDRFLALKLLESNKSIIEFLDTKIPEKIRNIASAQIKELRKLYNEEPDTLIANFRYGFIRGGLQETLQMPPKPIMDPYLLDNLLTHKFWGFPVFFLFMWLTFQTTFTIGSFPMDWIDQGVMLLSNLISKTMPEGSFKDLIVDGIIGGVGSVIVFLPNILILFFFISLMEDTGYMARAAFLMDRLMHKIGLHGKSFIPLLMGFGCNVPAIMATRTLDNPKDRILTILIIPLMSCSARIPVYVLFISAFFVAYQGLVLLSLYLFGIALAIIMAIIFKNLFFKNQDQHFVMELPPYRTPTVRTTFRHMWEKSAEYLKKMGSLILVASILIWALGYYPREVSFSKNYRAEINLIENNSSLSDKDKLEQIQEIETAMETERLEQSYIGKIGHFIEPIIRPMGWDWKIGVSIVSGLPAKEVIVSTMGVLYQSNEESEQLQTKLQNQVYTTGENIDEKVFTPLRAYSLMLFVLIYFPCIAVVAAINREANWKWALFTVSYTTILAWVVSFLFYQIGQILGF
jgi:ferrous iron transport protein B